MNDGHAGCPTCGHHTSAWIGGACTVFVPSTEEEVAAGAPWARHCGHDCSVDVLGESAHDRLRKALWPGDPVETQKGNTQ